MGTKYDAIVVGAGNGGMTASAALAQKGLNVLLLERHNIPGGCATSFCRGRFEFEVALHQLSGMGTAEQPGGQFSRRHLAKRPAGRYLRARLQRNGDDERLNRIGA